MVFVGKIVKFRGNKGEVAVAAAVDFHLLENGARVRLVSARRTLDLQVQGVREVNGQQLVKFAGIDSIDAAQRLAGFEIFLPRAEGGDADEPEVEGDLVGFSVYGPGGDLWGEVVAIEGGERNPLLALRPPQGEGELLIPLADGIVRRIDRDGRRIEIDPPAGLRELNR